MRWHATTFKQTSECLCGRVQHQFCKQVLNRLSSVWFGLNLFDKLSKNELQRCLAVVNSNKSHPNEQQCLLTLENRWLNGRYWLTSITSLSFRWWTKNSSNTLKCPILATMAFCGEKNWCVAQRINFDGTCTADWSSLLGSISRQTPVKTDQCQRQGKNARPCFR